MSSESAGRRRAHRSRVLRRPRHVVLRAVAEGDLRPPRRHRDRQHAAASTRPRARQLDERARALGAVGAPPRRRAPRVLRQGDQVPDHGQRAARPDVSAVRRRRARSQAQTVAQLARSSARRPSRTAARRPATTRCGSRSLRTLAPELDDPGAGARRGIQRARRRSSSSRSARCRCRRAARPTRPIAASGASRSAAARR